MERLTQIVIETVAETDNLDEAHRLEFFLRDLASLEKVNFSDVYKPLLIEKLEQKRSKKWRD